MSGRYVGTLARKAHSLAAIADFYMNARSQGAVQAPEDIIDFAYRHYPIAPRQVRSEILSLARRVKELRPEVVVEIGTHAGGTLFVLSHCAHPRATVVSIDLPGAQFSGGRPTLLNLVLPRVPLPTQRFQRLQGDSHNRTSVDWLRGVLRGLPVDLMLIDGDHTYGGVKQDFETYSPFVRSGGMVVLHDIVAHTRDTECKVDIFWNEIKKTLKHEELIENPSQGWAGLGLLYV